MKTAEIRQSFLKYFEQRDHRIVESSSLIPHNDPSLLFTNAGMVQFKDLFLGREQRNYKRATTAQKCVRAGGKHNDLENVGFTARHHTFFEMLGNFSFGDYFKKDAIHFAWEYTTKTLGLPKDLLYVTVYKDDDEAAEIWHKQEGVPTDRIYRFGEKDNFWAMGETGPCGPCSEIFIDRGPKRGGGPNCGTPDKPGQCGMGCSCDRYLEFWNLVFMQFDRNAQGVLTPLPKPSVDTGAGLERLASILQDVDTNYDTDAFASLIGKIAEESKRPYDREDPQSVSYRVIADHARAATFLISDGVLPSNEGRGYVLRRILRRSIRHQRNLGQTQPFLYKITDAVIAEMGSAYPELFDKKSFVQKVVQSEEEQFLKTLEKGMSLLDEELSKTTNAKLSGSVAFKLYDTYGFPLDLTKVISEEKKITVDETGFEREMARQRAESKKNWKGAGGEAVQQVYFNIFDKFRKSGKLPDFTGYDDLQEESDCIAILANVGGVLSEVSSAKAPDFLAAEPVIVEVVFQSTPFYGEGGGQTGDIGEISGEGFSGKVIDVQKPIPDLTVVQVQLTQGTLEKGKKYLQKVDRKNRMAVTRNHTATHLLHWALRKILGDHVKQSGSLVEADLLRFDFTHFSALTTDEVSKIESLINEKIWSNDGVRKVVLPKEEALKTGAIAFFGEKYGDQVRVVQVGDYSTEFCGGSHVNQSGDIHLFKIISESSIASGVRRIIAQTGEEAFRYLDRQSQTVHAVRDLLKSQTLEDVPNKAKQLTEQVAELKRQISQIQQGQLKNIAQEAWSKKITASEIDWVFHQDGGGNFQPQQGRELVDLIRTKGPNVVSVLLGTDRESGRTHLLIGAGSAALKTHPANELLKKVLPLLEGKGGGKPDFSQGSGLREVSIAEIQKALGV